MDRLVEAVAAHLCRHRSVELLRLTFDLTRRRLAEVGVAEVVKGVVAPPTPGTVTWWRTAVERRYMPCAGGGWPSRRRDGDHQLDGPTLLTNPTPNRQLRRMAFFSAFFLSSAFTRRRGMAHRLHPTPNEMNVKRVSSRPPTSKDAGGRISRRVEAERRGRRRRRNLIIKLNLKKG
jgi:hypothetical protein